MPFLGNEFREKQAGPFFNVIHPVVPGTIYLCDSVDFLWETNNFTPLLLSREAVSFMMSPAGAVGYKFGFGCEEIL